LDASSSLKTMCMTNLSIFYLFDGKKIQKLSECLVKWVMVSFNIIDLKVLDHKLGRFFYSQVSYKLSKSLTFFILKNIKVGKIGSNS
jgi:hypothetical protein